MRLTTVELMAGVVGSTGARPYGKLILTRSVSTIPTVQYNEKRGLYLLRPSWTSMFQGNNNGNIIAPSLSCTRVVHFVVKYAHPNRCRAIWLVSAAS
jgi:hypothetical protein